MINIGGKYLYTGQRQTMMNEGSEVVILRRGDEVTVKSFPQKNGWVYVIIEYLQLTWPVDTKFLTPLENFPEDIDHFSIFIYKFQQHLRE